MLRLCVGAIEAVCVCDVFEVKCARDGPGDVVAVLPAQEEALRDVAGVAHAARGERWYAWRSVSSGENTHCLTNAPKGRK